MFCKLKENVYLLTLINAIDVTFCSLERGGVVCILRKGKSTCSHLLEVRRQNNVVIVLWGKVGAR